MAGQANAQYKPTGDDGITASPKVRALLDERKPRHNTAAVPDSMACPVCKDQYVSLPLRGAKGGQILMARGTPTQKVVRHLCAGCDTTISVTGTGKAKHNVVTHTCSGCGVEIAACCSSDPSSKVPTRGMEKAIGRAN